MWNIYFIIFCLGNIFSVDAAISNLALHKPTQQKTTLHEGLSMRAVDGNDNGDFYGGLSCSHTDTGSENWWMVDLETMSVINEVRIKNRLGASGERLRDLNILIGKTQDNWSLCDYYAGPALPGEELLIKCPQPMTGRYVKLQKVDNTDALCLCEVEVMGRPGTHAISNLALHKPTQQRTTLHEGSSMRAVDGNDNGDYYGGLSCSHTDAGSNNWWMVDLETMSVIYEVIIKNRLGASGERLRDLNILIGKTQDNWRLCDYYAGPALPGEELLIKCPQPMTGRYVKLQKVDNTDALCLCEVEVMGRPGTHGLYSFHRGEQGVSDQMTSIDVKDEYQCALLCTMNPDCQQFNLNDLGTRKVCELLLSAVGTINYPPTVTHYSLQ